MLPTGLFRAARRRKKMNIRPNRKASTASPPTVPPTMAPIGIGRAVATLNVLSEADVKVVVGTLVERTCVVDGDESESHVLDVVAEDVEESGDKLTPSVGDAALLAMKGAARAGFEERNAAAKSPSGHEPALHGLLLQQPMNGGDVSVQVYQ